MRSLSLKRISIFLFIAALAYASWELNKTTTPVLSTDDVGQRHDPDYYAHNLHVYAYNKTGALQYKLKVAKINHFPDDNTSLLNKPDMVFFQGNGNDWQIRSDKGLIQADGENIQLTGDVLVTRLDTLSTTSLTTQTLLVNTASKTAQTDEAVTITDNESITSATGLKADLDHSTVELLSDVRGEHGPAR